MQCRKKTYPQEGESGLEDALSHIKMTLMVIHVVSSRKELHRRYSRECGSECNKFVKHGSLLAETHGQFDLSMKYSLSNLFLFSEWPN